MNATLRLEPAGVQIALAPGVAAQVVRDWLAGRDATVWLTGVHLRQLAAALENVCPDCGGPVHDDEVDQVKSEEQR